MERLLEAKDASVLTKFKESQSSTEIRQTNLGLGEQWMRSAQVIPSAWPTLEMYTRAGPMGVDIAAWATAEAIKNPVCA